MTASERQTGVMLWSTVAEEAKIMTDCAWDVGVNSWDEMDPKSISSDSILKPVSDQPPIKPDPPPSAEKPSLMEEDQRHSSHSEPIDESWSDEYSQSTCSRSVPNTITTSDTSSSFTSRYSSYFLRRTQWDDVEDELAVWVNNDAHILSLFHSVFSAGLTDANVLESMAFLVGQSDHCDSHLSEYSNAIDTIAHFLAKQTYRFKSERPILATACIRLIVTLRCPIDAGWQCEPDVLDDTVDFCCRRDCTWPTQYPPHSDEQLLWELKAICTYTIEEWKQQTDRRKAWVKAGSESAADTIHTGAHLLSTALGHSSTLVASGIICAGDMTKSLVEPQSEPVAVTDRQLAGAKIARRVSETARGTTETAVQHVKEASCRLVKLAANKTGEAVNVEDNETRQVLTAAGKVGWASLGAAAILTEAVLQSTRTVADATIQATAEVARHRYGPEAGQMIQDTSETATNVIRTAGQLTLMNGKTFSKAVAKKTVKDSADDSSPTKLAAKHHGMKTDEDEKGE